MGKGKTKKKLESSTNVVYSESQTNESLATEEMKSSMEMIMVPPPTPASPILFEYYIEPLPDELPNLVRKNLPVVREKGVKLCMELLSKYFGCAEYKFNLVQFWFLDMVTDCLWKVQDEFRLPEALQKTVLEWILHIFDKIRGTYT